MHKVHLIRVLSNKRVNTAKIREQIAYLVKRALGGGRGNGWTGDIKTIHQRNDSGAVAYSTTVEFTKNRGHKNGDVEEKQWDQIFEMLQTTGNIARFGSYPWKVSLAEDKPLAGYANTTFSAAAPPPKVPVTEQEKVQEEFQGVVKEGYLGDVKFVLSSGRIPSWEDLHIPPELIESDEALSRHPAFRDIYDLNPQIRMALSAIDRSIKTKGKVRTNTVFWGHAGCGKTTIMKALMDLLGHEAFLMLDATSTTRAGLEDLFFKKLDRVPPIVYSEEVEKAPEDALKVWLGALDERGEIRKVKFGQALVRKIQILFLCTVNNKAKFDSMMGSDGSEAGALSSRCVNEIYCPRPKRATLSRILQREIRNFGGKEVWIEPALDLATELKVTDPRRVKGYLAGGNRLIDGSFQKDRLSIRNSQTELKD